MKKLFQSFKRFIKNLLSGSDEVSSNRTVGIFAFIVLTTVIYAGLYTSKIPLDKYEITLQYLIILIFGLFGLKTVDGIKNIFAKKDENTPNKENQEDNI